MSSDRVALTPPPSQQPGREKQQRPEQRKYSFQRDSHQTQRQRQQPDKRKHNQRKHGQRPAEHEQNAPTDKQNECPHKRPYSVTIGSNGPLQLAVGFRAIMAFCERIQECLPLEFRLQLGKLGITLRYLPVLLRYDPVLFGYRLRMFGDEFLMVLLNRFGQVEFVHKSGFGLWSKKAVSTTQAHETRRLQQ